MLLVSCALSLAGFAQNETDAQGRKQGRWTKNYPNGKLQYEGQFKNDCEEGVFKYYNSDGSLKQTIEYKGDCKTGYAKTFYKNGNLVSEGSYVEKKKEGLWKYYSADGKTLSEENYVKGLKDGIETLWDTKGNVLETITWRKGKKQGENYQYLYVDGYQTFTYSDDQKQGAYRNYYANKKPKVEGEYKNNKKEGLWSYFDEAGDKLRVQKWENNTLVSDKVFLRERKGNREVASSDIAYLYPLGKQTCVFLFNGEKLTCFNNFDQILDCTDGDIFVRLNKKNNLYANYKAIVGVKSPSAKESEVILNPKTDITITADQEGMKVIKSVLDKSKLGR